MLLNPLTFHSPHTVKEAAQLYESLGEVKILAGGTFLLNSLKFLKRKGMKTPSHILCLKKIPELQGIELTEQTLTIKAMTRINDLFESSCLVDNFSILRTVCRNISTHPIRNMATVGGNLTCRYTWTELGAVMIALDARMHFMNAAGAVSSISAEEFFKNGARSDKIFTHLTIQRDPAAKLAYRRIKKTMHVDVPLLTVCIQSHINNSKFSNVRICINNGANFAQRDSKLEQFLNNAPCQPETVEQALDHMDSNIYDKRSDEYKSHMFRVCIKNSLLEIIHPNENP